MSDNELIAKFMGGVFNADSDNPDKWWFNPQPTKHYRKDAMHLTIGLKYDTEWDWLMPVVEKIERIKGVHTVISELGCDIYSFGKRISDSREDTKLKTVYKAVVEFIKFHNSQKS